MEDAQTVARRCLHRFASAWLDGDDATFAETCLPTVHWWSPFPPENLSGADRVGSHLGALLRDVARPVEITALIANRDGTRGVVEMLSSAADGAPSTALTSVVGLSQGKVTNGRTYVDVKAHPSLGSDSA